MSSTPSGTFPVQGMSEQEALAAEQGKTYAGEECAGPFCSGVAQHLSQLGERNLQNPRTHRALLEHLGGMISANKPFSLVRLGDGEGNTLFWHMRRDSFPELAEMAMYKIMRLMFGKKAASMQGWNEFAALLADAVSSATIVGLPTEAQVSASRNNLTAGPQAGVHHDVRGAAGVIATWDWASRQTPEWWNNPDRFLVNWHVHKSLLDMTENLVKRAQTISVVTCYPEILGVICQRFGAQPGQTHLIPPQAVNIGGTPVGIHYPDTFAQIRDHIAASDLKGHLVLVGAGLLGKVYCELVRQSGGMAIDVGSMMDVWIGKGVRPYQNDVFVEKYRL